jgi:hypothetical protein
MDTLAWPWYVVTKKAKWRKIDSKEKKQERATMTLLNSIIAIDIIINKPPDNVPNFR